MGVPPPVGMAPAALLERGADPPCAANIVMFYVMTTALTVVIAWVFNNARGSLLITMLMHASFNTFANKAVAPLFPARLLNDYGLLPVLVGFTTVAVIVVAATRGRLSYHGERRSHEPEAGARPASDLGYVSRLASRVVGPLGSGRPGRGRANRRCTEGVPASRGSTLPSWSSTGSQRPCERLGAARMIRSDRSATG